MSRARRDTGGREGAVLGRRPAGAGDEGSHDEDPDRGAAQEADDEADHECEEARQALPV